MAFRVFTSAADNTHFIAAGQRLDDFDRVGYDGDINIRDLSCQEPAGAAVIQQDAVAGLNKLQRSLGQFHLDIGMFFRSFA